MTPPNAELPNFNACRKHQDTEVYGEYGQRGCEDCVFTAKLIQAREQQLLTELLSHKVEVKTVQYNYDNGEKMIAGFTNSAVPVSVIERYREEL